MESSPKPLCCWSNVEWRDCLCSVCSLIISVVSQQRIQIPWERGRKQWMLLQLQGQDLSHTHSTVSLFVSQHFPLSASPLSLFLCSALTQEFHKKRHCEQSREKIHTLNKIFFIRRQLHQRGAVLRTFGLFKWEHTRHRVRLCARDDRFYDTVDVFTAPILSVLLIANNLQRPRSFFQNVSVYNCEVF